MKKLKVLALCAVLVGLGGAMSALTAAQEKELHDFYVDMAVQEGGVTKEEAEMYWNYLPDSTKDELWMAYQSAGGGLGSGSGNSGNNDKDDDDYDNPPDWSWGLTDEVFEQLEEYKGKMTRDQFINEAVSRGFAKSKSDAEALADALEDRFGKDFWKGGDSSSGEDSPSFDISGIDFMSLEDLKNAHPYTPLAVPTSQSGLVSEVDDYMDVNSWQSVQFDKLFTHVGYNINNQFNAGLATRLGKVYIGGFFYGNFIDSTTTTSKSKVGDKKSKETISTTDIPGGKDDESIHNWGDLFNNLTNLIGDEDEYKTGIFGAKSAEQVFQLSALIGIGNLGIKPSILFAPKSGNSTTKVTNDGDSVTVTRNAYEIYPQVDVGFNLSLAGLALTPHAHVGFDFAPYKTTTKNNDKYVSGSSNTWTMLGFGTGLELPKKDGSIITHSFSMDLDFAFRSKTKSFSGTTTSTGEDGFTLGAFTLGWTGNLALADNLSVKFASTLPIEWGVKRIGTAKEAKISATEIAPTFATSLKYQATQKLALGLSADLGLPAIEIMSVGAGDNKNSSTRFNTEDHLELEFGAGFRFDFTQNVTLDCGWSFGGNLFNNYFKDVSDNSFAFWDGLSYIFSDIQLGLSVKF